MSPLDFLYKKLEGKWFILTQDLHYPFTLRTLYRNNVEMDKMVSVSGVHPDELLYITVPKGFVTDLASIPDALQNVMHPDGPWALAACLHDLLYQKRSSDQPYPDTSGGRLSQAHDKHFADLMFLRTMEATGVSEVVAKSFYDAVHLFGESSYVDDNSNCHYTQYNEATVEYNRNYVFFRTGIEPAVPRDERDALSSGAVSNVKYRNIKRAFLTDPADAVIHSELDIVA
jgi:hypothetical protein